MKRVLFVINDSRFFLSHRLPLAIAARERGYEVHVATPEGPEVATVESHSFKHHAIPLSRSSARPWQELRSLFFLLRLFRRLRPSLVHLVTIKPVLYGGIAARLARVPAVVSAVSGLGYLFVDDAGIRRRVARRGALLFYRLAMRHRNQRVICQNPSDRERLVKAAGLPEVRTTLIRGSGVDLSDFAIAEEPDGPVVIVMASRLLRDKGVQVFVEAARQLVSLGANARFVLAGAFDPGNPTSIDAQTLRAWRDEGLIEWLGHVDDIAALFMQAHIVTLPSYYGEGLPKVLIEAAACGRAIVTTDLPGCRDAIEPNVTGLLVEPRSSQSLAESLNYLIENPEVRRRMGLAGRKRAEREFSIDRVVEGHLTIYGDLMEGA